MAISTSETSFECIEEEADSLFRKVFLGVNTNITDKHFSQAFCGEVGSEICNSSQSGIVKYQQCLNRGWIFKYK